MLFGPYSMGYIFFGGDQFFLVVSAVFSVTAAYTDPGAISKEMAGKSASQDALT